MAESNENAGEEDILAGAEGEEDTSTEGAEEEADGEGTGADDEGEDGDGADEGDDDAGDGEDDADFVIPEKFKGKDAKAIAKSYTELEKNMEKKIAAKVREEIAKARPGGKVVKADDEAIKKMMEGVDFSKMKPEEFAAWLIKSVESRAQEISRSTYQAADSTKEQIQRDIAAVQKTWPAIKENENFRSLVLTLIENKASKGEILTLKEAAKEAGKILGIKPGVAPKPAEGGEGEPEPKPRPKTGVERASGAGGGEKQTDEEAVLAGIMGGGTPGNKLGGMGI